MSQSNEDYYAKRYFFGEQLFGFFLELGGLNGVQFSNTYLFEHVYAWSGIMIEPDPRQYTALVKNRPNVLAVNAAVCNDTTTKFSFARGGAVGGLDDNFANSFKSRWKTDRKAHIDVYCMRLDQVLQLAEPRSFCIDFFSLDVEGSELEVIKSVDLQRYRFKVIVVEEDGHNPSKNRAVSNILYENQYEKVTVPDSRNGWYRLTNSSDCSVPFLRNGV